MIKREICTALAETMIFFRFDLNENHRHKSKIDKWEYMKIKNCTLKETIERTENFHPGNIF
jgi:hypothetical protein